MSTPTARQVSTDRVKELIAREEDKFKQARPRSQKLWQEAREVMPRGVPSSFQDAARIARGFTGRQRLIKMEASYHGHHDALMVSVEPPPELMGPADAPASVPQSEGIPHAIVELTTVVPFNDLPALERAFTRYPNEVAAVIV